MCALKLPKGYRFLKLGEVIQLGDMWGGNEKSWVPEDGGLISQVGRKYAGIHAPCCRRVTKPTRREPRVSRIATIIQRAISGQLTNAMEGAHDVERIIDNAMRKKRHAKAKKRIKKSAWRILRKGEAIRNGDEYAASPDSVTWKRSDAIGLNVPDSLVGHYRRKVGAK